MEGWSKTGNDGIDDVTILVNSSPKKLTGLNLSFADGSSAVNNSVLSTKASMLWWNVPSAILLRFLWEHRSERADLLQSQNPPVTQLLIAIWRLQRCNVRI